VLSSVVLPWWASATVVGGVLGYYWGGQVCNLVSCGCSCKGGWVVISTEDETGIRSEDGSIWPLNHVPKMGIEVAVGGAAVLRAGA